MGIEPTSSAWKAEVLPLNYTRGDPGAGIHRCRPGRGGPGCRLQRPVRSTSRRHDDRIPANLPLPCLIKTGRRSRTRPALRSGGGGRIRTYVGISQQIYSLPPLATRVPLRGSKPDIVPKSTGQVKTDDRRRDGRGGAGGGNRTPDPLLTRQSLYRLSYASAVVNGLVYQPEAAAGTAQAALFTAVAAAAARAVASLGPATSTDHWRAPE